MSAATHQTGAYVLKACRICGQTFPVLRVRSGDADYCPECTPASSGDAVEMYVSRKSRAIAKRRAEFFAARDAAFERAGLPIPKISVCAGGRIIERRGNCAGTGISYKFGIPTLQPSERKSK